MDRNKLLELFIREMTEAALSGSSNVVAETVRNFHSKVSKTLDIFFCLEYNKYVKII